MLDTTAIRERIELKDEDGRGTQRAIRNLYLGAGSVGIVAGSMTLYAGAEHDLPGALVAALTTTQLLTGVLCAGMGAVYHAKSSKKTYDPSRIQERGFDLYRRAETLNTILNLVQQEAPNKRTATVPT